MKTISELMSDNVQLNPELGNPTAQKERIEELLRAKSGKGSGRGTGPKSSAIQAQMAQTQAQTQATEAQQAAVMAATAVQGQEQQLDEEARLAQEAQKEESKAAQANFDRMKMNIENTLKRDFQKLEMSEREEVFRAAATIARLDNKKYIHELTKRAKYDRIDSEAAWKKAFAETQAKDSMIFFRKNMMHANVLFEEKFAFREMMDGMSIDQAMLLAEQQMDQQQAQMIFSGMGSAVSGGAQIWAANRKNNNNTQSNTIASQPSQFNTNADSLDAAGSWNDETEMGDFNSDPSIGGLA